MENHESNEDQTRSFPELIKGTMVSHYRIIEKIGVGGMGEVYLAEDTKLKRKIALKFLSIEQSKADSLKKQFMVEAMASARMQHPNIITVHEVNEHDNTPFIAMAYLEGQTLKAHSQSTDVSISGVIEFGKQIAAGLTAAHNQGVTHRDLKPGNVMVDSSGVIQILDFGLAVFAETEANPDSEMTKTNSPLASTISGTISYMAPEQIRGLPATPRVDIFAMGVILYELVAGEHPFPALSYSDISARILRDTPASLFDKRSDVPYDLERIIGRCLQKNPERRFQTARDVYNELKDLSDLKDSAIVQNVATSVATRRDTSATEKTFSLSTDLVRKLSYKEPKMIGAKMAYLDNGVASDDLIVYLHGIGHDQRQFADVLCQLPFRALAVSLFGFDHNAQLRLPLTLHDHSILLHAALKELRSTIQPRRLVLVGFSSGADQVLDLMASGAGDDLEVNGILPLGCNLDMSTCFVSSKLAELTTGDEEQTLATIKQFGNLASSLDDWLLLHEYLVVAFSKFTTQTDALRQYAGDIMQPFVSADQTKYAAWYKAAVSKIPHVRFVFDKDCFEGLDKIMQQHLESNLLGDDLDEKTIVRDPIGHMELGQTDRVVEHTLEFMKLIDTPEQ